MKPLRLVIAVAAIAVISACTPANGDPLDGDARAKALAESAHAPRRFLLSSDRSGQQVEIEGSIEDDYRYTASLSIDGRGAYEETVIDDRRWLRVTGADGLTSSARGALSGTPELSPLTAGEWVRDASGAPPEFEETSVARRLLGPDPVLEVVRRLDILESDGEAVTQLRSAREYDPESVNYLEREDKFERHAEDGARFDIKPSGYDPDAIFGTGVPPNLEEALEPYALYTSFWIEEGRVTRIETFFDVDTATVEADLAAIIEATAQDSGLPGVAPPPVPRPYREVFTLDYPDPAPRITPPETAVAVRLPDLPGR